MIKQGFFFVGLFLLAFTGLSQTNDILTTEVLRKGVYRSFEEFRTNSPSLTGEFYMKEKSEFAQSNLGSVKNKLYHLDSNGNETRIKHSVWGYCDGENVYILWDNDGTVLKDYFLKIQFLGRYCLFEDSGYNNVAGTTMVNRYYTDYVLNINNGEVFHLKNKVVKIILERDSDMLKEFKNETNKSSVRREYIKKYCLKYPDEIKAIEQKP